MCGVIPNGLLKHLLLGGSYLTLATFFRVPGEGGWHRPRSFPIQEEKISWHLAVQEVSNVDDFEHKDTDDVAFDQVFLQKKV